MSNSFRDAIKQVMTEGAKEKTSDGMTPDAKHFRHDLHKVQDAGFKHMVQKDSETGDYEKMFKPAMEKMPTRLSDVEPDQGLDKYVEYNEAVKINEKKHMKGCTCESCMNKEDKEDEKEEAKSDKKIAEASVMMGRPGMQPKAPVAAPPAGAGPGSVAPTPKPYGGIGAMGGAGTAAAQAAKGTTSIALGGAKKPAQAPAGAPDKASSGPAIKPSVKPGEDKMAQAQAAQKGGAVAPKAQTFKQAFAAARAAAGGAGGQFTFKGKQYQTNVAGEKYKAPTAQKPVNISGPGRKPSVQTQSYEIEVNGKSYMVSEAHAAAIAAYVEKYGQIDEKSDPAVGEFISKEMKHPEKLTAQGKKQKIKQAIAIYYSKKRHGEKP